MFWVHSDVLPAAAHIWAAAAGTAGAFAPRHIVDALLEGRDLFSAAIEGTRRADQEVDEDWPSPRGCEILVESGVAYLLWETERHRILLSPASVADEWGVIIRCRHHRDGGCDRIQAAEAVRRLWEEHSAVLQKASSSARHGLIRAATMVSRMLARGELSPADLDIASSAGLHALWGVLWAWRRAGTEALQLVESMLGYTPSIGLPAHKDLAGIVIDTPIGRIDLDDAPAMFRPSDTMAVIIRERLQDLNRPEFDPVIRALGVVAGVEETTA